jgi:competence protein ComEA
MKNSWKAYFSFSKKERLGLFVLMVLIIIFLILPEWYQPNLPRIQLDTIARQLNGPPVAKEDPHSSYSEENKSPAVSLFYFDPNTITSMQWSQLGLRNKTVQTILNYRNKGGKFKVADDIKKIWGLSSAEAERLLPYIRIKSKEKEERKFNDFKNQLSYTIPKSTNSLHVIDVNLASLEDWESLPGIGKVLGNRIVRFREKLGGFTTVEQVKKTYGISDSVFQLILPYLAIEKKATSSLVSINYAGVKELEQVGIEEAVAKAIVLYRKQNGPYLSLTDLKKIVFINETVYQEIIVKLKL